MNNPTDIEISNQKTAALSSRNNLRLFVMTPMSVDADSTAVEHFVAQHWHGDVTDANYPTVAKAFVDWWYGSR